jgi:hypothetical protein
MLSSMRLRDGTVDKLNRLRAQINQKCVLGLIEVEWFRKVCSSVLTYNLLFQPNHPLRFQKTNV